MGCTVSYTSVWFTSVNTDAGDAGACQPSEEDRAGTIGHVDNPQQEFSGSPEVDDHEARFPGTGEHRIGTVSDRGLLPARAETAHGITSQRSAV